MTTKPTHPKRPRRLGLEPTAVYWRHVASGPGAPLPPDDTREGVQVRVNAGLPPRRRLSVAEACEWLEWATGENARSVAVELARMHYLHALATEHPHVLTDLRHVRADDEAALAKWAGRWHLGTWGRAWARATITTSGGRYWCPPTDGTGVLIEAAAPTRRSRTARALADAAPLIKPATFAQLAQLQSNPDATWINIADFSGSTAGNVRRDCLRLAKLLDIPLRPLRRGRSRRKKRPAPND